MKILIADDHALFRDELASRLEEINPDIVLMQAPSFSQSLKIIEKEPDLDMMIVDLDMPDMHWEESIEQLRQKSKNINIVVISASEDMRQIRKILQSGIKGYIPKRLESQTMHNALKLIVEGGIYIPPALVENNSEFSNNNRRSKTLTNRQSQVLDLIAEGKSNKQIAYEMGVSEATVKLHINALLRSLKVNNRTQAVITAQKMGLI